MDELRFAILTSLLTAVESIFDNSLGFYIRKKQTHHLLSSFLSPDGDSLVHWSSADSYSMLSCFFSLFFINTDIDYSQALILFFSGK